MYSSLWYVQIKSQKYVEFSYFYWAFLVYLLWTSPKNRWLWWSIFAWFSYRKNCIIFTVVIICRRCIIGTHFQVNPKFLWYGAIRYLQFYSYRSFRNARMTFPMVQALTTNTHEFVNALLALVRHPVYWSRSKWLEGLGSAVHRIVSIIMDQTYYWHNGPIGCNHNALES